MARINYSGLVTSIRGSIGGTTFQSNAYGFTIKNKPNMIRPNTPDQQLSKIILSKAVKDWAGLTSVQRDAWNTFAATFPQYAKNNPSSILTGFAVFVKWHTTYYLGIGVDNPPQLLPITVMPDVDIGTFSITVIGGVMTLTRTWVIDGGDWACNVYISRPFRASQNFVGTQTRFMQQVLTEGDSTNITARYLAKYGALPTVGSILELEYELLNNGGGKVLARVSQRITVT